MIQDGQERATLKSAKLKYSLVLTGMFRFKPASQYVEGYHSVVSSTWKSLFRIIFVNLVGNKERSSVFWPIFC
jgi:hypothetical protein